MNELQQQGDVVYFARTDFRNANRLFGMKRRDRRQHLYICGKTGTGKTALLHNLAVQDIMNGEGLCVVDPHGEFVETLLQKIPKERINDVVYFNPADPDSHVGFNVLELPDPKYKHLAASGLMAIFTKIWSNVWSARMEYILNNAILALLESPNATLLGITRILVDADYRQQIVANIKDPVVKAFWVNEYEAWRDQFRNEAIAPIQNKVGQFLSSSLIRNIVGQEKSTIDIFDVMNSRKILLVNVSKGRIGEDNSALLGAMIITKIQLAAMERVRIPDAERKDFYLYVDEFQNFATDSFASILSEARKYRLNLIVAHQYIGQLVTDVSTKVRDAIFGNVGTMILFRVGAADAEFLENEFTPEFTIQDMVNLPNHHIYLKLMVDGVTSRPFSATTIDYFKVPTSASRAEEVVEASRANYARPREEVESDIISWSGMMGEDMDMVRPETPPARGRQERAPARDREGAPRSDVRYAAVCSNCGKKTELNFRPTEGKPVYCRECLQKIQSGVLPPIPVERAKTSKVKQRYLSDLSELGIAFDPGERGDNRASGRGRGLTPPAGSTESTGAQAPKEYLSLRDLTRKEEAVDSDAVPVQGGEKSMPQREEAQSVKKRSDINIAELREAVRQALRVQSVEEPAELQEKSAEDPDTYISSE